MNKLGLLFPGQGAQFVGMGKSLRDEFSTAASIFERADDIMGESLTSIMWEGPEELLRQTTYTQPAIVAHSLAALRVATEKGLSGHVVATAGHSLGEYVALVAAGVIDESSALRLVKRRGELMQKAGDTAPGAMAAILGLSSETVDDVVTRASKSGIVVAANRNAPEQTVISGEERAVVEAMERAGEAGARRVIRLSVSGAFHSPLMNGVSRELSEMVHDTDFSRPSIPVVPNVSGIPTRDPEELKSCLLRQIEMPVLWTDSIRSMITLGVNCFIEFGPGKVLSGLNRKIDRTVRSIPVGDVGGIEALEQMERSE